MILEDYRRLLKKLKLVFYMVHYSYLPSLYNSP